MCAVIQVQHICYTYTTQVQNARVNNRHGSSNLICHIVTNRLLNNLMDEQVCNNESTIVQIVLDALLPSLQNSEKYCLHNKSYSSDLSCRAANPRQRIIYKMLCFALKLYMAMRRPTLGKLLTWRYSGHILRSKPQHCTNHV